MMKPRPQRAASGLLLALALVVLTLQVGCAHVAPEAYVPQDALLAVGVPHIGQTLGGVKAVADRFGDTPQVQKARAAVHEPLLRETGLDLDHPETLRSRGFDPTRGLYLSVAADKSVSLVLPVADKGAVETFLRDHLVRKMATKPTFEQRKIDGAQVTVVVRERPRLAWTFVGDHVIFVVNVPGDKLAEYAAGLTHLEKNLAQNPAFVEVQKRIGPHDVLAFSNGETGKQALLAEVSKDEEKLQRAQTLLAYYRGGAISLRLAGPEIVLRGYLALNPDKGAVLHQALRGIGKAPDFAHTLGTEVMALTRGSVDVLKTWALIRELSGKAGSEDLLGGTPAALAGPARQLLALLAGRYAVVSFAPDLKRLQAGDVADPGKMLLGMPAALLLQLTKPEQAAGLMMLAGSLLAAESGGPALTQRAGQQIYTAKIGQKGAVSWSLVRDLLVVGTEEGVQKAVDAMTGPGAESPNMDGARARELLASEDGFLIYADLTRIAASAGAANQARASADVEKALPLLARLRDALLGAEVSDDAILSDIILRLK